MKRGVRLTAVLFAAGALAACQTTKVETVERKIQLDTEQVLSEGQEPRPVALLAIETDIRRGQQIGTIVTQCGWGVPVPISWRLGKTRYNSIEIKNLFHDELEGHGIPVPGTTGTFFGVESEDFTADYVIGATLREASVSLCRMRDWWTGVWTGQVKGKGAATYSWEVMDRYTRKLVYTGESKGSTEIESVAEGDALLVMLEDTIAVAANNLAADPEFLRAISNRTDFQDVAALEKPVIRIEDLPLMEEPISENVDRVKLGSVLIELPNGHGSGFIISRDGLVLTNHHVAGKERFVQVRLASGRVVVGEVLRAHEERDAALIKIEGDGYVALPIRRDPVRETETVYAVGAPIYKELQTSITRGTVSSYRMNAFGLQDIQADADIQGGNSGGPLLDDNGNIVGQSYAGLAPIGDRNASIGVNFFNPIMDVLDKLQIEIDPRISGSSISKSLGS